MIKNSHRRGQLAAFIAFAGSCIVSKQAVAEFLVTPWTASSPGFRLMSCASCKLAGTYPSPGVQDIYLANPTIGSYQLRFAGTPWIGTKVAAHVTALGVDGARCQPYFTGRLGTDYIMAVSCQKNANPVNTRFIVDLLLEYGSSSSASVPGRGFAVIQSNALTMNTWASNGSAPTLTHSSPGGYTVTFPGLSNQSSGGNAQATAATMGNHCSIRSWGTSSSGSYVSVNCYDNSDNLVDSDVTVSFEQQSGNGKGFVWANQPSASGFYTPYLAYNRGANGANPNSPMTIYRAAPGRYFVRTASVSDTGVHAQATAYNTTATCNVMDLDIQTVYVACTDRYGNAVDSYFSLIFNTENTFFQRKFYQVPINGTNFNTAFDVGQGLACGTSPTQAGVICVTPASRTSTSPTSPVGGGAPPAPIKSVAVGSVDGSSATVLALGTDNVVYQTKGSLGPIWDPTNNFTSWTVLVRPTDMFGSPVTLSKIVSVRTTATTVADPYFVVLGLTTAGKAVLTFSSGALPWVPYNLTADGAQTFLDIGHGRDDVYAIQSNHKIVLASLGGGVSGPLPDLPNGLLPIAIGGRYVLTNAGKSGSSYPCTGPKDSQGYYNCPGATQRIYRLMLDGTWRAMLDWPFAHHYEPAQDDISVVGAPGIPKLGDPLAAPSPTIVDGDAFEGNFGSPFVWQWLSRFYQLIP